MRQSTAVFGRVQDVEFVRVVSSLARNTWLPPRLTIRNVSPAALPSMATMSLRERPVETGRRRGGLHRDLLVQVDVFGRPSARVSTSTE